MLRILLLLVNFSALCGELIKVDNLYIEGEKTFGSNRNWSIPLDEEPRGMTNLGMRLKLSDLAYINTKVSGLITDRQYREIKLDMETGLSIHRVDVYIRHMSSHSLDYIIDRRFPEVNAIGIRYNILK